MNHLTHMCNRPGELICKAALLSEANCVTHVVLSILHKRTTFSFNKIYVYFLKRQNTPTS